ncbi:hypothetical protein N656DRAFT_316279 [Canariomyces notabilis]|uniref:Nephrocystin 3-like N-terminal domain-containing protein n=1 Tax=Canariomyces notabilis TaxID=2074819 RepID=A0AAN6TA68_9PEZI|nr:hypothetical protein N656DRAFT_316279 [Canariomyces arenarius]
MDGLSTAASIVAVLQLAGTVLNCLNSVRNAPKELEKVFGEISSITGALFLMQTQAERAQQDQEGAGMLFTAVRSLSTPGGPLEQFKAALKTLASKFSPVGAVKKLSRTLAWPFEKSEIAELLLSLERLKSYFMLALQSDSLYLSRETKGAVNDLSEAVESLRLGKDDQECRRILNWLNTADMEQKHQDVFSLYQEGTCSWFLGSDAVDAWLGGEGNHMLWCPGDPGAGKTVMTSVVIEHVKAKFPDEETVVAMACCHLNDPDANTSISIISSLVKQLAIHGDTLHREVHELYHKMTKG